MLIINCQNKYKNSYFVRKAAMFGLDARIALAIFGALSVITGAALFSAIQKAKYTSIFNEMNEVGKAWEQFYLDTKTNFVPISDDPTEFIHYIMQTWNLVENDAGLKGGKGPYLKYLKLTTINEVYKMYLDRNSENSISLLRIPDNSTWGESVTWPSDNKNYCLSGKICYLWVEFGFHNKKELGIEYATNLDRLFDNGNGANTGKIRWQYSAISTFIIFKYAPIRNPNG